MLHIILGILKIIGIILGILLLILLAVACSVLFAPLRYRIQLEKQPSGTDTESEERIRGEARLSWLLHIVSVSISVDSRKKIDITLRLFGIRLPFFRGKGAGEPRQEKPRKKKSSWEEPREIEYPESGSEILPETKTEYEAAGKIKSEMPNDAGCDSAKEDMPEGTSQNSESEGAENPKIGKIRFKISRICDKIKEFIQSMKAIFQRLATFPQKLSKLWAYIQRLSQKPGELISLAEKYEVRALLGDGFEYIRYLLRHYKPRRISGYVRFGVGDPARSAQLTGLIYLLLPARADKFSIKTEFNEAVFETELVCSGHIRLCHGLRIAWRAFRNKKIRKLLHYLRNGDNK